MASKLIASVQEKNCVACGCCLKVCPRDAISLWKGSHASVDTSLCVGCGKCARECPASVIDILPRPQERMDETVKKGPVPKKTSKKHWYDYLWIVSLTYLALGMFQILSAWLGMICFLVPLIISITSGSKLYCNRYCGRGQLFSLLGERFHLSRKKSIPRWMNSKQFRYGFLVFFLIMFCQMLFTTYLVFRGSSDLRQAITILWTFRLPWNHAYSVTGFPLWVSQFAFGFYSVMLTSTILGLGTMILFLPRSWCVYCPMGTMTQMICQIKARK